MYINRENRVELLGKLEAIQVAKKSTPYRVIAELNNIKNLSTSRYNHLQMTFDGSYSAEEVISAIDNQIAELKKEIREKKKKKKI